MLSFVSSILLAQATATITPLDRPSVTQYQEIRTLPGRLNDVLVFNSNSPEVIRREGILLSTFPKSGKRFPPAHLNQALQGRFDVFTHHIARAASNSRDLYQGILIHNPTSQPIILRVLQAGTYLTSPDAPFVELPSVVEDPSGRFFSGPGSRLMGEILRRRHQTRFPKQIIIPPRQSRMILNMAIPKGSARSTLMRLHSSGSVYMANLTLYEVPQKASKSRFRAPTLDEWKGVLIKGKLVEPRDIPPTPIEKFSNDRKNYYSRVAGVSVGSEWVARLVDPLGSSYLTIPKKGKAFSYPLSTVTAVTLGTQQIQSAPMLVRYPDTALQAHGNYAVHYHFTLPLYNNTRQTQVVALSIQTPLKQEAYNDRLFFIDAVKGPVFFRGAIRVTYRDEQGKTVERYFHLVQREGQQGKPLLTLEIPPRTLRDIQIDFLYPPDATPPQVLTVQTVDD